ncbi:flavin reductase family protein [Brevibacillus daliensis]|uniref:flavin reductase family protein n=1 Tax=Brevibacillus daliensis TaxID=2892995 RepID=UPI001E5034DC|nr:flavin reductase family protein [Brevibacillus daliensis]
METHISHTDTFKAIMGSYPTGVTIITTTDLEGNPAGLTANSFTSVSISPLLVLFCVDEKAGSLSAFRESGRFAVHVLAEDQQEICWRFASREPNKFNDVKWSLSERKLPVLPDCAGLMECKTVNVVEAGDHTIFIGEVEHIEKTDNEPLLYFRRKVGSIPANWNE